MKRRVRKIVPLVLMLIITTEIYSQCDITATANTQPVDSIFICQGDQVNLQSQGDCDNYLMMNDFNDGTIGQGWNSNASPMFTNPCGPGPDGTTYLWIGPATNFPRELVTVPYAVNTSCRICFDMKYSVQAVSAPCEGPDLPTEGVHLQWSSNGGATWTDIDYWAPNGGYDANMTNWRNYCRNVPVAGTNIQFRWYQTNTSGNNYDHWGIDNVIITCPSPPTSVWWTGPGGFSYNNWNPPTFSPTQSGWYAVHLTDGQYSASDSIYIHISPPVTVTLTPSNPTLCYGQTSTVISATVTGGTPPFQYAWSNGATTPSVTVGPGTYTLVVQDYAGCSSVSASVTVNANAAPVSASAGPDQTLCITATTVTLNATVAIATGGIWTGGSGVYSPSNTSLNMTYYPSSAEIQNGLVTLILTTTGNGSCPAAADSVSIYFSDFLGSVTVTANHVNCNGGSDGSLQAVVSGGSTPHAYVWSTSPPQTTATASGLSAGSYVVTITDNIGCTSTATATVTQPPVLTALISSQPVACFGGATGYATVTAFGGTPGYSYIWSNGATSPTITGLTAGNYSVTITDASGCQFIVNTQITSPTQLSAGISNIVQVLCSGQSSGSATVIATGGTPGYNYSWSGGAGTSATALGLSAGSYGVTVTDLNGCSVTSQVLITEPSQLGVAMNSQNVTCYGGSNGNATVTVTGGNPPYQYVWSPYGGAGASANGLVAGVFTVTVTDANACQMAAGVTINQPPPLLVNAQTQNVQCFNTNTGSAVLSVTGGVSPYTYNWNPAVSTQHLATGLGAGNYQVTVSDANNCTVSTNVFVNQPLTGLTATISVTGISCYGYQNGSMTANPLGGTPPYTYVWQPGAFSTQTITSLQPGNYFVTVTDASNCSVVQSAPVGQPGGINLNASTIAAACGTSTGQASVSPSGGTSPYTYNWMPGGITTAFINSVPSGIYYVTVTDALGCSTTGVVPVNDAAGPSVSITGMQNATCFGAHDGQASASASGGTPPYLYVWFPYGGNAATATGLGAGTYSVVVSDAAGCQGFAVTNPAISQPPAISVVSTQVNVACAGASNGAASLNVSGGTPPYSYQWLPGGYTFPNIIGLHQGVYNVTITDFNNCEEHYFVDISEPAPLTAAITASQNISCYGLSNGSATVTPSGGTPPYSYSWSPSGSTSQTATGLNSGTHTVFVADSKGCSYTVSLFLTQPSPLTAITGYTSPLCNTGADGMAWVFASGGSPPYAYTWSPFGGSNDTALNMTAGIYSVMVTDNRSCQIVSMINITQPPPLTIAITNFSNVNCYGGSNGYAIASVSGGTPPYTYSWANGITSPASTNLTEGVYYITVTDAAGCTDVDSVVIQQPAATLSVTVSHQNVSCYGGSNGSALAQVTGGTAPYTYIWVPVVQFTPQAVNLTAGTYTVSVIDINGCQASANVTITHPPALITNAYTNTAVQCYGTATGSAFVNVSGGLPPYDYSWNTVPSQTTAQVSNVFAGMYQVTITDAAGCTAVDSVMINEPPALIAVIVSNTGVTCYNGSNAIATGGATGGTPPYFFAWSTSPVQTTQSVAGLAAGNYTLTITDNNGCTATTIVVITQPTQVVTYASSDVAICRGGSTVISATASGGVAPHLFNWNNSLGFGPFQTVAPQSNTSYVVTAFDANGCAGLPDTVTVHVKTLFPQDVEVSAYSPICPGNSSQVTLAANCGPFDTLSYAWSHGLGPGTGPFVVVPAVPTWYVVTVSNTCGFTVVDSALVDFAPSPVIQFSASDNSGCAPLTIEFTDSSFTTFDDINYWQWNFGDGTTSQEPNTSHTFQTPGTYLVWMTLVTTQGCTANSQSYPLHIFVYDNPVASFSVNATTVTLPGEPVVCNNTSQGAVAYWWSFGDGYTTTQVHPLHLYSDLGNYEITLIATNTYHCSDTATLTVSATSDIVFPNVFTPDPLVANGGSYSITDYSNQVFFPYATGVEQFSMQIYNRWGELIFETNDIAVGWDGWYRGEPCQQDVYVYKATATFIDGRIVVKRGDVLILR